MIRLCALAAYAVASGAGGAWIAGPLLGALDGHFLQLWVIGALTVFAAAAFTAALQVLLGLVGIGVAILLFVVLGNPSAGGAYSLSLLPEFWRVIGDRLPTGAATTLIRDTVYFTGHGTARAWWVLAGYAAAGIVIALAASMARFGRGTRTGGADRPRRSPSALRGISARFPAGGRSRLDHAVRLQGARGRSGRAAGTARMPRLTAPGSPRPAHRARLTAGEWRTPSARSHAPRATR
ncbi:hypothetical protein ACFHW2_37375 [Actinomadura sp. LOL_016]|uniref:hypothetical protein n=1 Tax=unclassified Actinomadura TaxID=2626254 RepID=UPI003A7FF58A